MVVDQVGPGERQVQGDAPAEGAADEGRPADVVRRQRLGHRRVQQEPRIGYAGLAAPRQVQRQHPVAGPGERGNLRPPHPAVGDAGVQQDDGVPLAEVVGRKRHREHVTWHETR